MSDIDKLTSAIATARARHDAIEAWGDAPTSAAICRGAMLEAIEILAELLLKAQSAPAPACQPEPSSDAHRFDAGLVTHLTDVFTSAVRAELQSTGACGPAVGIRAALAELAKAPVELPSAESIAVTFAGNDWSVNDLRCAQTAIAAIRSHIAPAIAARDTEIAQLREVGATLGQTVAELSAERVESWSILVSGGHELPRSKSLVRFEPDDTIPPGQIAKSIRLLVSQLETLGVNMASANSRIPELVQERDNALKRVAELEKRLADQTPVDASGKTPGQVLESAIENDPSDDDATWEYAAQAVLRIFGGAALRRVRESVLRLPTVVASAGLATALFVQEASVLKEIDAELAKLEVNNG